MPRVLKQHLVNLTFFTKLKIKLKKESEIILGLILNLDSHKLTRHPNKQLILLLINSLTQEPLTTCLLDSWDAESECEQDNHDSSPESGNLLTSQEMILRNTSSPFQRRNRLKSSSSFWNF